uniref:Odorant binding protein 16 n=1 Tax=Heliconius charithonia TaxID=33434 RepID=A0AA49EZV5_HELCH|nr:odorant binding protein 16 [Heliconius charithonia]
MTRPQLKKTLTIMKNQCMPKYKVTNEKVGQIEQGVFVEDHDVMCYIACVYKTAQVVKNKRLDKDLVSKQIDVLYPAEIREAVKLSTVKCIPVQYNYEDECEGIFYSVKCLYEDNPANFIFP